MTEIPKNIFEQQEREPREITSEYYFFRHDAPVYGPQLMEMMSEAGFSPAQYSKAEFKEPQISYPLNKDFHPSEDQLNKFAHRKRSEVFEGKTDEAERIKFEGAIISPAERKNISTLISSLQSDNVIPLVFTGPRTRHGLSTEAVLNKLREEGIDIDQSSVTVTDMLTDINKHWIYSFEIAKEAGLNNPWQPLFDPEEKITKQRTDKGIESMEEIAKRARYYVQVLDRLFNIEKNKNQKHKDKKPAFINFTSDFYQLALLNGLGIEMIDNQPTNNFRPAPGSYIKIEVLANDDAHIYYQSASNEQIRLLSTIKNFHQVIQGKKL